MANYLLHNKISTNPLKNICRFRKIYNKIATIIGCTQSVTESLIVSLLNHCHVARPVMSPVARAVPVDTRRSATHDTSY
jgi:hypothetical protein